MSLGPCRRLVGTQIPSVVTTRPIQRGASIRTVAPRGLNDCAAVFHELRAIGVLSWLSVLDLPADDESGRLGIPV